MIRRFFYILLFLLTSSVLAFGAPKLVSTRIQVLTAPTKLLKLSDTLNIAIIANIYADTRSDSLIKANYPTDSLLAVKAAFALKQYMQDSPIFTDYDFPVYNYARDDSKTLKAALSFDVAKQLAGDVEADYLLTVDIVNTDIWYEVGYPHEDNRVIGYASSNVAYEFIYRFYDVKNNKIQDTQIVADTLVFEATTSSANVMGLFKEIMVGQDAVVKACEQASQVYADLIVPHWVDEIRYYFNDGSRDMKQAVKYVEDQQWAEAINIWIEYTSLANQKTAAMACFNMALACEMTGDFDLAIEWLDLAKKKNSSMAVIEYQELLKKRIADKIIIDKSL